MGSRHFESDRIADTYVRVRPRPPRSLIENVMANLEKSLKKEANGRWPLVVDVGSGSGQTTFMMRKYFDRVLGCDISSAQIRQADKLNKYTNVSFKIAPADSIPVPDESVDLITASECVHWFDLEPFYVEVDRVLKPNGVLAVFGYHPIPAKCRVAGRSSLVGHKLEEIMDQTIMKLYDSHDWNRAPIDLLLCRYETLPLPYTHSKRMDNIYRTYSYAAQNCVEYISSLSAFERLNKEDPQAAKVFITDFEEKLKDILMGDDLSLKIDVTFEFFVLFSIKK
ncbi:uncharacterized protein LOC141856520 [Brevipalpus obovatus]|uniref:uncharacterized protein LOC141856520 n=1 Tax=Brevipalpus obovatus TaxID=246614 RepID=UPI003D9EBCC9